MAKYDIKHTCGHTITHNIVGKIDNRAGKADWLAEQPCYGCKRTAKLAADKAATANLVDLTGSDKQVKWATTIRADALNTIKTTFDWDSATPVAHTALKSLENQSSASWWIDQRANTTSREWLTVGHETANK